MAIRVKG